MAKKKDFSGWSKEQLVKHINKLEKRKKYGLVWDEEREPEKVVLDCKEKLPILKEIKNKAIQGDSVQFANILIEGDNYHALSVLNYTHEKAVDVIYIDPPYNRGNNDFIYNDKYIDKEDGYKHSKWLSFMKKRLQVAKNILNDTGVIFISIDDTEQAHLRLLCDEVFGEDNFINNIIWQKKFSPSNDSKWLSDNHDFIVCYAKQKKSWRPELLVRTFEQNNRYKNLDNDSRGPWTSGDLSVKTYSKEYDYEIETPSGRIVSPPQGGCWRTSKENFLKLVKDNRIWFGKDGNNVPRLKRFLSEVKEGVTPLTIWTHQEVGHNQAASQEIKRLFSDKEYIFETPKPVSLIKRILQISTKKNSIILDFFAGSGTTGHAVMEMNNEDGGTRQFILCTNNENKICEDITYPRIKKVINGYDFVGKEKKVMYEVKLNLQQLKKTNEFMKEIEAIKEIKGDEFDEMKTEINGNILKLVGVKDVNGKKVGLGGNLQYFKTGFVPAKPTDKNKKKLTEKSIEMLCLREGTFEEVLNNKIIKIFKNSKKYTAVLFDELEIEKLKKKISKYSKPVSIYVFSLTDDNFADEFRDMNNVKVCSIPEAILKVYRSIFK